MKRFAVFISLLVIVIAPFYGQMDFSFSDIFKPNGIAQEVFFSIRVPRVMLAFLTGGVLSLSGLVFQSVFKLAASFWSNE